MYILSACLIGNNCKYSGGNNRNEEVRGFMAEHHCCIVCPELAARLPIPRAPAEKQGDRIVDRDGQDLTTAFRDGALVSWNRAQREAEKVGEAIEGAILKANSPSCGSGMIYDGSFSGTLIPGDGVFAAMLKENNISVYTEKEIEEL
jgi:uncharacterized protein YbbK (DUF523 family)